MRVDRDGVVARPSVDTCLGCEPSPGPPQAHGVLVCGDREFAGVADELDVVDRRLGLDVLQLKSTAGTEHDNVTGPITHRDLGASRIEGYGVGGAQRTEAIAAAGLGAGGRS